MSINTQSFRKTQNYSLELKFMFGEIYRKIDFSKLFY